MKSGIIRLDDGRPSTLWRMLAAGDKDGARAQFARWISPDSPVEERLKRRRKTEQLIWDKNGAS